MSNIFDKKTQQKKIIFGQTLTAMIRAWMIPVTDKGEDSYGNIGKHEYLCALTKDLTKGVAGIKVRNIVHVK
ncbi:MAG: hypothetical protein JWP78_2842 [Mucilaginibacter sp.]|nr:hypothetical protein [Mucilaginibacter sp.]